MIYIFVFKTNDRRIKLGDFGVARQLHQTMESAKTRIGTPLYLSPGEINVFFNLIPTIRPQRNFFCQNQKRVYVSRIPLSFFFAESKTFFVKKELFFLYGN